MLKNYENKLIQPEENKEEASPVKKNCVIIASGPSLTKADVEYCKGKAFTIVINNNYEMAPWADILYACDPHWWGWHKDKVSGFKGRKITQNKNWNEHHVEIHGLEVLKSEPEPGLSTDPDVLHTGSNGGYQAINLAYHLGFKRIILLGYDMQATNGKKHWHPDHPNQVAPDFPRILPNYNSIASHAKKLGLEIINCTRETALTCFPRMTIEQALSSALVPA
jgi:hypothetical protein